MTESSAPPDADRRAWEAAAASVLRKSGRLAADAPDSDVWQRLSRSTVEGVPIPALGTAALAAGLATSAALGADPGAAPFLRGSTASARWDVRSRIADPDPARAHATAVAELALWVVVGEGGTSPADLAAVLADVPLDRAPIVLDAAASPAGGGDGAAADDAVLAGARVLATMARERGVALHPSGSIGADPIGRAARRALAGAPLQPADDARSVERLVAETVAESVSVATDLGIGALVVDGTAAHDAGAGDAAEIGYVLAAGAAYLRLVTEAGVDVDDACRLLSFRFSATDEQFATIAKLRAARLAWHRVAELSGASPAARAARQHAVTSSAMMTRYDSYVNMLRGTIAAFAAAVGGAEAITVEPFDAMLGIPEEFGNRMARNISALLTGESHLDAVADPAGGAYAVEMLTASLAEAAWAEFDAIESAGGTLAALADGSLAERLAGVRLERERRIATRRQPITGVSEFPNADEHTGDLPTRRPASTEPVRRWAEPFEAMRDDPPPQPIRLVRIGTEAAASPRMLFIRNLLAAGGIAVDISDAAVTSSDRRDVVMIVGSDADYADGLAGTAAAVRAAGARTVLLSGRPKALLAELPDGLIDGTVAAGDDVLTFLRTVRTALGGAR